MKKLLVGLTSLFLISCEKVIDIQLNNTTPKLVVEATIENGQAPVVVLTRSVSYFSQISPQLLTQNFVHNADVVVSNGTLTHKLKEYTVPVTPAFNLYYYSIDSTDLRTAFVGEFNKGYSLRITAEGKEYTAATTIPNITRHIDSLWWKPVIGNDTGRVAVIVRATDPKGYGDYIRYFTKRNREPFYPPLNSVYDDLFIDGTTYELQIDPGVDRNATRSEEEHFFHRGDTLIFKVSNIDKATFDFWQTMEYSYSSVGNPFATPTKVLSNISNGALGYFGGYASQYRTLIIPR